MARLKKPTLFAIGGVPGVGKSTVAKIIATRLDIKCFTTDNLKLAKKFRKLTAPYRKSGALFPAKLRQQFYKQLYDWAKKELQRGRSVVLDATFSNTKLRSIVYQLAKVTKTRLVPIEVIKGKLNDPTIVDRMRHRHRGDPRTTSPIVYRTY